MAEELGRKADKAFVDEEYETSVQLYSDALQLNPSDAVLFASRAQAYLKLDRYMDAISDTNKAIELNPNLPKAYLRKGVACFNLEEYQTAKAAFEAGLQRDPNNPQLKNKIRECEAKLIEEASGDQQSGLKTPKPLSENPTPMETVKDGDVEATPMETANGGEETASPAAVQTPPPPAPPRYRHEFYQTSDTVVVTVFAKNIQADQLEIQFGEQILSLEIKVADGETYVLQNRLFGKIKPTECKYSRLSTKVEIRLVKAEPVQWKKLEYDPKLAELPAPKANPESSKGYPSSTKKTKDWDKLEAEVKKQEKDEKLEGDAALNKLFQDIYKDADEDTRRAMNKSFVESNGTVLSTNWKEVSSKQVEKSPPKGMEVKSWDQ
ncbi:suppressor of G2 allele of SKP1 [Marchantia polymorpha subsp. ruderalis]|uniref:Uncharacterized protein n=2 Tax=Marchantia polymorpha TaxID=3197 RepID=A0A176WGM4_MARPO|nr:hypothetical protein AXG93_3017s1510 [Marchantia polymorpha subsp. ruderalis]PTQ29459.1 hypothetical protein MARPO_0141s0033 [Marchantia polymorpha]PTQ29460.1 hypothetical protein MARPO_0141s0033 [Marchantia polymorpha]BBN10530.1 hypothetical protein Mp_5g04260 [Marchantia polymorpha subsp. ruderalis]BBN10531.1 hypothetical protein Mp_5g04260 [Marchantia polymorpha subsp. ruderalis]|eukprot:PTQ29459.1 hypothetical protein MARPO_0141s0033 [Marchantia polymorpha]